MSAQLHTFLYATESKDGLNVYVLWRFCFDALKLIVVAHFVAPLEQI